VGLDGRGGIVSPAGEDRLRVGLGEIETLRRGRGRPILLIHGINPVSPQAPFLEGLADHGEITAPSAPGFGHSPHPTDFDTMYDLIHLYREVLDGLPGEAALIGFSFGGWIAAEIAAAGSPKIDRLVLVDPVGIKIGGREERDIVHFFNTLPEELNRRSWHDPACRPAGCWGLGWQAAIDDAMSDEDMILLARNWDALCLYAWRPHMYNPQLKHWLHRISVPTLVLWGASDRIVTPTYGRAYADLIPGARFEIIEGAGHHPELEQPRAFVDRVANFLDTP
jgi:pimeloyl-ACP methyl ester carboxylesterase